MTNDLATIGGAELGRRLRGVGLNILTHDAEALAQFMADVFAITILRADRDFALLAHDGGLIQLHSDAAFGGHPLAGLVPENPPRGAGVQIYLFNADPDAAAQRAADAGGLVLEPPRDKPHGLREATVLAPEGQAFTAARRIGD